MKIKTFSKKLALNKATVVNLTNEQLDALKGGHPLTSYDIINHCYTQCIPSYCGIGELSKDCPTTAN
jgi:hypothetical protein